MLIVNCTPLSRKDGEVGGKELGRDDKRHEETGKGGVGGNKGETESVNLGETQER